MWDRTLASPLGPIVGRWHNFTVGGKVDHCRWHDARSYRRVARLCIGIVFVMHFIATVGDELRSNELHT